VLNETGGTTLPANDSGDNWALEESLDVQWAHAIAPQANISLFEASSSGPIDLYTAAKTAAATAGVSVVSMSWGGAEFSYESVYDSYFTTPSGHSGVTFLASTGDSGAPAEYPAFSPNVLAVGGTTLTLNSNGTYVSESAWARGGGGISQYESQPAFQNGKVNGTSSSFRTAPDVSMDASSSVAVLDSYNSGWTTVAGTSLSCPMWAGLIAIADQGLALNGVGPLDGGTQTLPTLYNLPSSDFHDITTGNNGFPATTGYDLATGLGTPVANLLVSDVVSKYSGNSQAPSITSANQAALTAGTAGSFTVTATGAPAATFGESGALPTGLSFNSSTGVLSGTPAAGTGGTYNLTFTATNGVGSPATQNFTLTIGQAPTITSTNSATFTAGTAGSFTLTATGFPGPTFSESGSLPTGLSFNSSTGVLSGTPSAGTGGTYVVTFTASNGVGQQASQSFTITIKQAPAITSANSATFTVGTAGSFSLSATGFPAPTFGETGSLPAGLTFNSSTGVLSGTPSAGAGGSYSVTLTASNGVGQQVSQNFTITIDQAAAITSANGTAFSVGSAGSFNVTATGFPGVTFGESGALPSGVNFNAATGTLSGMPAAATSGTYHLTFTANNGVGQQASQSFTLTVQSAQASKLAFTSSPTSGTAGQALSPSVTVAVEDQFGDVVTSDSTTVTLTLSTGLFSTGSATANAQAVNGVATFSNLIVDTAGSYTLAASDGALSGTTSSAITIAPGAASKLVLVNTPTTGTAGQALGSNLTVAVEDAFGNVITGNTSTVSVAVSSGPAGLASGSTTSAAAASGIATFGNLVFNTAGAYTLSVSDGSLAGATSATISVSHAAASKLAITQSPTRGTAGQALNPSLTVAIEDAFGNLLTTDSSTVSLAVSSGPARLANSSITSVAAVNGVATFSAIVANAAGTYSLSISDGSLTGATSGSITINPGAASKLFVSDAPISATAGQALNPSVTVAVLDAFGNAVTTSTSTVTIAVNSGPAGFATGTTLSAAAVNGVATFSDLILDAVGSYTLSASASGLTSGTSTSISLNPAAASKLFVSQVPAAATAGGLFDPPVMVAVQDAFGNAVTSNTSTITLSVSGGPSGFASGSTTSASAVNGLATFSNLILDAAGTYFLNAADGSLASAKSTNMTVNTAAASKLVIRQAPTTGTAGQALSPTLQVAIEDEFGNVISNTSTVSVAVNTGPAGIANNSVTSMAAVNGVATFSSLTFDTAGTYTVKVSDGSFTSAISGNITIGAAAASKLAFARTPATGTAGQALSPAIEVAVEDTYGNAVTSNTSQVSLIVSTGPGSFTTGSTRVVAAVNGIATFSNLVWDQVGTYQIGAGDGSLTRATSTSITIAPGAASKLAIIQAPTTGTANKPLSALEVAVDDQFGNIVKSDASTVTIAVKSGPHGFSPSSTTKVAVVNGIATFSNVILPRGTYTLKLSDGLLTTAVTASIAVS
jgi:hypothetical protein